MAYAASCAAYNDSAKKRQIEACISLGSFASLKPVPNDIDVLLVFSAEFSDDDLSGEIISVLDHEQAKVRYQADVFWIRDNLASEVFDLFLDTYQKDREQRRRGIVEILL